MLRPGPLRSATLRMSSASAEEELLAWLERTAPPGASVTKQCMIVASSATSVEGALRDFWQTLIKQGSDPEAPPVTVLMFPDVEWLQPWQRFSALHKHLLSCRDCCTRFGTEVRITPLHPATEPEVGEIGASIADLRGTDLDAEAERRRAPFPAFTFTTRVSPSTLRPPGPSLEPEPPMAQDMTESVASETTAGDYEKDEPLMEKEEALMDEAALAEARSAFERQFRAVDSMLAEKPSPTTLADRSTAEAAIETSPSVYAAGVLKTTMAWFEVYFARVYRVFGSRQRRVVMASAEAEQAFATFWEEAAVLVCDDSDARLCAALAAELEQPEDPVSSLIVLPGLAGSGETVAGTYRAVRQTLALSLATLGLAESFTFSAFHPRDTFEVVDGPDERRWEMTLEYPIIHLVRKKR